MKCSYEITSLQSPEILFTLVAEYDEANKYDQLVLRSLREEGKLGQNTGSYSSGDKGIESITFKFTFTKAPKEASSGKT